MTDLPESFVESPWELVRHEGKLRLAYMVKYFGEGFPSGSFTGGRGFLVTDGGELEAEQPIVFKPVHFVQSWKTRPTARQLQHARLLYEAI